MLLAVAENIVSVLTAAAVGLFPVVNVVFVAELVSLASRFERQTA